MYRQRQSGGRERDREKEQETERKQEGGSTGQGGLTDRETDRQSGGRDRDRDRGQEWRQRQTAREREQTREAAPGRGVEGGGEGRPRGTSPRLRSSVQFVRIVVVF